MDCDCRDFKANLNGPTQTQFGFMQLINYYELHTLNATIINLHYMNMILVKKNKRERVMTNG